MRAPLDGPFWVVAVILLVALALGGGGVRYGFNNLVVQLGALGAVAFYRDRFFRFWSDAPLALKALVVASAAIPVVQLVALPEAIWTSLPGRALAADARALINASGWAPVSLDSARTIVALSGLIVPVTVLAMGWTIGREHLPWLGWGIVAFGLINLVLGSGQVVSSEELTSYYPETSMPGVLFGTFANRNSTGLFLVAALSFAALLPFPYQHPLKKAARTAVCALLFLSIILTQSRTALALSALPLILAVVKAVFEPRTRPSDNAGGARRYGWLGLGAIAAIALAGAFLSFAPGRINDTLERFESDANPRAYIWEDAFYASERYWPVGAGMGTFDEVFQADEALENMTQRRAGRAHNDYIEVAIEAGFAGVAIIAAWLALWAWLTVRARQSPDRWIAWSGSAILLAIALQSITDYPLRNQSLLAVGALALLILTRCGSARQREVRAAR
ncbi:MAG: O-antigen ligase family protein [Pseudomonadota bacterium]